MNIRAENNADYDAIDRVVGQAFGQPGEARLVRALRQMAGFDPGLSLVAELDGWVVGHILFSPIVIETTAGEVAAIALAPMAVTPKHQRCGIGSQLVREGLDACGCAGHRIVIVLGHADYYPRFGFVPASRHGIHCPFKVSDDVFMALELQPGALDGISGTVRYPPPFSAV